MKGLMIGLFLLSASSGIHASSLDPDYACVFAGGAIAGFPDLLMQAAHVPWYREIPVDMLLGGLTVYALQAEGGDVRTTSNNWRRAEEGALGGFLIGFHGSLSFALGGGGGVEHVEIIDAGLKP